MNDTAPDEVLVAIAGLAEKGISVGLTLTVGGAVIAGMPVSAAEYFQRLSSPIAAGFDRISGEDAIDISAHFEKLGTELDHGRFIHLIDAALIDGPAKIHTEQSGWRIRLSSVDAFMVGVPTGFRSSGTAAR